MVALLLIQCELSAVLVIQPQKNQILSQCIRKSKRELVLLSFENVFQVFNYGILATSNIYHNAEMLSC